MQTYARQFAINLVVSEHPHPPRRVFDPSPLPSRVLCVTGQQAPFAILISVPLPRSYFDGAQHERPRPFQHRLCKGLIEGEGTGPHP